MAGLRGLFVQRDGSNNGTTPKGARLALAGLLGRSSTGTVEVGVLVDTLAPVVTGTGAMSYSVRAFALSSKLTDANGPTISANDSPVTVATTDAPGTNPRIDTIYAVQRLTSADGSTGSSNAFDIEVIQGSSSATPSPRPDADLPTGAVRLANVEVTPLATSTSGLTFTRAHRWVTANGGIVPDPVNPDYGWVWNGSARVLVPIGSQQVSVAFRAGYLNYGAGDLDAILIREGRRVTMMGAVRPSGTLGVATMGPGSAPIADVPVGWRPMRNVAEEQHSNTLANKTVLTVDTAGVVRLELGGASTFSWLQASWITPDPTPPSI